MDKILEEDTFAYEEEMQPLFGLDIISLVREKAKTLTELRNLEINVEIVEQSVLWDESNILLKTDFKALGLDNEIMMVAYITKNLYDKKCKVELDKITIEHKKDKIEIIDLLIRFKTQGE